MRKALFLLVVTATSWHLGSAIGAAHSTSTAHINITPKLCVLDVVQDGNNQILQASPGCETALPHLLLTPGQTSGQTPAHPLFALPFAGTEAPGAAPILQPRAEAAWTPIVSKEQSGATTHTSSRLSVVASGLAMAAIASAIGIDIALFELHYSRSMARWLHRQSLGRIAKR